MFHSFSSYSPRYNKVKLQFDRMHAERRRESESGSESARRNSDRDSLGSSFDETQLRQQKLVHGFTTSVTSSLTVAVSDAPPKDGTAGTAPMSADPMTVSAASSGSDAVRRQLSQVSSLSDASLGSDVELSLSRMSMRESESDMLPPRAVALECTASDSAAYKPSSAFVPTVSEPSLVANTTTARVVVKQSPSALASSSIKSTSALDASSLSYSDIARGHVSLSMTSSMSSMPDSPPIISSALRNDSERTMKPVAVTSSLATEPAPHSEDVLSSTPTDAIAVTSRRRMEVTSEDERSHAFERVKHDSLSMNNEVFEPAPAAAVTSALKTVSHFNISDLPAVTATCSSTPPRSAPVHMSYSPASAKGRQERVFQRGANSASSPALKDLTSTPKSSYLSASAM